MSTDPPPLDPIDVAEPRNAAIIKGGIRSLGQAIPIVGGILAQAWSEYESYRQNERVEQFFEQLTVQIASLERDFGDLKEQVGKLPDVAELIEALVDGVKRETQADKRPMFANALAYFMREPTETSIDERRSIIADLEILTLQDIHYLQKFVGGTVLRGDWLSDSVFPSWATVPASGGPDFEDDKWDGILGPAINSLAKIESRGLLIQTAVNATFGYSGTADTWYNRFRAKAWRLTPIGAKLLAAITGLAAARR